MKEIRTLRGKDRKVFSLGDGMTQAVFYPSPVHVFDDETRAFEEAESKLFASKKFSFTGFTIHSVHRSAWSLSEIFLRQKRSSSFVWRYFPLFRFRLLLSSWTNFSKTVRKKLSGGIYYDRVWKEITAHWGWVWLSDRAFELWESFDLKAHHADQLLLWPNYTRWKRVSVSWKLRRFLLPLPIRFMQLWALLTEF